MGKLVVVYGMDDELEEGLERLRQAGVSNEVSVVQRGPVGNDEVEREAGRVEGGAPEVAGQAGVVVPPSATLGTSVPMGTPAAFAPNAVVGADADLVGAAGYTRDEIEDLTGAMDDEADHLLDIVRGGGSLLVVEGDDLTLDVARRALHGHSGQGAVRH